MQNTLNVMDFSLGVSECLDLFKINRSWIPHSVTAVVSLSSYQICTYTYKKDCLIILQTVLLINKTAGGLTLLIQGLALWQNNWQKDFWSMFCCEFPFSPKAFHLALILKTNYKKNHLKPTFFCGPLVVSFVTLLQWYRNVLTLVPGCDHKGCEKLDLRFLLNRRVCLSASSAWMKWGGIQIWMT